MATWSPGWGQAARRCEDRRLAMAERRVFQFGERVEGYAIPVLNEREIRAGAGILFVLMFVAITRAALLARFTLLKFAAVFFLADILIRVVVSPRYAPFLVLGRLIVRNQVPEYVGAPQKRFAWIIGIALATTMVALAAVANTYGPITGIICLVCLVFLLFETAFGICLGCKVYPLFHKGEVQHCPGEVCTPQQRQEIQRVSRGQWLVLAAYAVFLVLSVRVLGDTFREPPRPLFAPPIQAQAK
jgi:hypothetical protein